MNKQKKKMWIEALKSGAFKQCRGYLEKDGKYCALGVLSILSLLEGQCTYNQMGEVGKFDNRRFTLSYNTMKWANIAQLDDEFLEPEASKIQFLYKKRVVTIADLNDGGLSFVELADIIEKNL